MSSLYKLALFTCLLTGLMSSTLYASTTLTWKDCLEKTRLMNAEIKSAASSVEQAREELTIAYSSLYPTLNLSASVNKGTDFNTTDPANYSTGLSLRQLIFDGYKTPAAVEQSKLQLEKAQLSYNSASANIRYQLRSAFISLLKSDALLELTKSIAQRRKQNLALVKLRYEAGREHAGSLLTAEADLAQAEFEVDQAMRANKLARLELANTIGLENTDFVISGNFDDDITLPNQPDFDELLDKNFAVRESKLTVDSAQWSLTSAYAELYPSLSLSASASLSDDHWVPENKSGSVGLSLSLPLFAGGSNLAGIGKAKQSLTQAKLALQTTMNTSRQTLEESWKSLLDASELVLVQKKYWQATRTRAKIVNAQYSSGLATFDDWTLIEDNLVSAQKSFLNTKASLLLSQAEWSQTKGVGLDHE